MQTLPSLPPSEPPPRQGLSGPSGLLPTGLRLCDHVRGLENMFTEAWGGRLAESDVEETFVEQ